MRAAKFAPVFIVLLLAACRDAELAPARGERLEPVPERQEPIPVAGPPRPAILFPRHRVISPTPPIILFIPCDPSPIELEIWTSRGVRRRLTTRERTVPWPASIPPLAEGELGWITLWSSGQTARCGFERAAWRPFDFRERSAASGISYLLDRGLPIEAFLLSAVDPAEGTCVPLAVRWRAGLPVIGQWRQDDAGFAFERR